MLQYQEQEHFEDEPDELLIAQAQACLAIAEAMLDEAEKLPDGAPAEVLQAVERARYNLKAAKGEVPRSADLGRVIAATYNSISSVATLYGLKTPTSTLLQMAEQYNLTKDEVRRIMVASQSITPQNIQVWAQAFIHEEDPVVHAYTSKVLEEYVRNDPKGKQFAEEWNATSEEYRQMAVAQSVIDRKALDTRIAELEMGSEEWKLLEAVRANGLYLGAADSEALNRYLRAKTPQAFAQYQEEMRQSRNNFNDRATAYAEEAAKTDSVIMRAKKASEQSHVSTGEWASQRMDRLRREGREHEVIATEERMKRGETVSEEEALNVAANRINVRAKVEYQTSAILIRARLQELTQSKSLNRQNSMLWDIASNEDEPATARQRALLELLFEKTSIARLSPSDLDMKLREMDAIIREVDYVDPNKPGDETWVGMAFNAVRSANGGNGAISAVATVASDGGNTGKFLREQAERGLRKTGMSDAQIAWETASFRAAEMWGAAPDVGAHAVRFAQNAKQNFDYDNQVRGLLSTIDAGGFGLNGQEHMGRLFDNGEGFGGRGNDKHSLEEIKAGLARAGITLARVDKDHNGTITSRELENAMREAQQKLNNVEINGFVNNINRKLASGEGTDAEKKNISDWMKILDSNHDGKLTKEEVHAALRNAGVKLSDYDSIAKGGNDDGITKGIELTRALQAVARHHREHNRG